MVEFRWIIFSSFLMLLFDFTAETGYYSPHAVRVGDEVTLSCEYVKHDQDKCGNTTWFFRDSKNELKLIDHGQIHKEAESKSDRLSVTENCSLVIKKVTVQDVGLYTCRQIGSDSTVFLFVVTMTEHEDAGKVTLNCSVMSRGLCEHTVKWLYEGKVVNKENRDMETSHSKCSVNVTFPASYLKQKSDYHELFKCEVTHDHSKEVQQFNFSHQSSGEKTADDATTTKSPPTIKSTSATGSEWTSVKLSPSTNETSTNNNNGSKQEGWWWIITVSVGVAALLIFIVVAVIRWKRTKGNKTQTDENLADPEDGVSYASISYNKKTNSRAQGKNDDEGDTVTYSTVKASSSSAGASADPSSLYAAVNKPNR